MTAILGATALVVDVGYMMMEQQKLSDAVDATALAGAQELVNDEEHVKTVANEYALKNEIIDPKITINNLDNKVTAEADKEISFFFARILGFEKTTLHARSTAQIMPVSSGFGFVPLGVVQQNFDYGKIYTLKYDPYDASSGNFGALALGGTGASNYLDNLVNGYQGKLMIGMNVDTETGNMSGSTRKGVLDRIYQDYGCYACNDYRTAARDAHRLMYLPVIDSLDLNGRDEVTIVGFAAFYLEDFIGNGNESYIKGRFLKTIYPADWEEANGKNFGLYAVKLVE